MKTREIKIFSLLSALCLLAPAAFSQGSLSSESIGNFSLKVLGEALPDMMKSRGVAAAFASDPNAPDDDGTTSLMRAARDGDTERVSRLVKTPGVRVDEKDYMGRTALMLASIWGRTEAARVLLEAGAKPNAVNRDGETALMFAASQGHTKTAKVLLDGGAEVNLRNAAGNTVLIQALSGGRTATVALIASIPGIDLNAKNAAGTTPLMVASHFEMDVEKLTVLLDRGADKNLAGDFKDHSDQIIKDYTPLMVACEANNLAGVKVLLSRGVDVNYRGVGGKTALSLAKRRYANKELLDLLVAAGAKE